MKKYRIKKETYDNGNYLYFIEVSYLGIPIWFKIEMPLWGGTADLRFNELKPAKHWMLKRIKKSKVVNTEIF